MQGFFFNPPVEDNYLDRQLNEIYTEHLYAPFLVGKKDLTIFDIGANLGMATYYFSQFAKKVHAFEPAKEHFEVFKLMLDFNKITNVEANNYAITNEDSQAVLNHPDNKTMYSLRLPGDTATNGQELVTTMRLDTYVTSRKVEHIDFMKMDIEGLEPEVICGDGFQNIAPKVDTILMEIHTWMSRNPQQIRDALLMAGFTKIEEIPMEANLLVARK